MPSKLDELMIFLKTDPTLAIVADIAGPYMKTMGRMTWEELRVVLEALKNEDWLTTFDFFVQKATHEERLGLMRERALLVHTDGTKAEARRKQTKDILLKIGTGLAIALISL